MKIFDTLTSDPIQEDLEEFVFPLDVYSFMTYISTYFLFPDIFFLVGNQEIGKEQVKKAI